MKNFDNENYAHAKQVVDIHNPEGYPATLGDYHDV